MGEQGKGSASAPALRKMLAWLLSLVALVIVSGLIALGAASHDAKERAWDKTVRAIDEFMLEMDISLSTMNKHLSETLLNNENIQTLFQEDDPHTLNVAARDLYWELNTLGELISGSYNFYAYDIKHNVEVFRYDSQSAYSDCNQLRRIVQEKAGSPGQVRASSVWEPVMVAGSGYLLQFYQMDNVILASWLPCESFLSRIQEPVLSSKGMYLVSDREGRQILCSQRAEGYSGEQLQKERYAQSYPMRFAGITLTVVEKPGGIEGMPLIILGFFAVILLIVAGFSAYALTYFQRYIQRPFEDLQSRVNDYMAGRQIAKRKGFAELNMAMSAFDDLARQLETLRIEQYEEKVLLAKTQLEYFQLQIKPHFFVNSYSIIYGMAQKKEFSRIQEFCLSLSGYVRFLFRDSLRAVQLKEELETVRKYLDIQNIRYRIQSGVDEDIPPELLSAEIPPLLLLTFVENAVKHRTEGLEQLAILLRAGLISQDETQRIKLTVMENSPPFTQEELERLNSLGPDGEEPEDGQHLGIKNTHRRLSLLFGVEYSLRFSNLEGRPAVEITLPYHFGPSSKTAEKTAGSL